MSKSGLRVEWIDLLRVIAIFAVVLVHATESIYRFNVESMETISMQSKVFAITALAAGRLGVPIFLMITGYLLLDREYDPEKIVRFWKNNWLRLLVCTEIWVAGYDLFLKFYAKQELTAIGFIQDLLFVHKVNMGHVWYMPMILGFYLLIPFVARALKGIDLQMLRFPLSFFIVYSFGYPFAVLLYNVLTGGSPLQLQISLGFSGGTYGIYLIMGYVIKRGILKNFKSLFLTMVSIVSFLAIISLMLYSYHMGYAYNVWYNNLFIFIATVTIFELGSRIQHIYLYPIVKWFAKYSFGVYFIHYLIRLFLKSYVRKWAVLLPVKVMALFFISNFGAFVIAYLLDRIPKIGKWILYLKE